jgi:excisionase family DNA binding protein
LNAIKPKDAAKELGVPINTLYTWIARKQIPHLRLSPRTVLFDRDELLAWIASKRVSTRADGERAECAERAGGPGAEQP